MSTWYRTGPPAPRDVCLYIRTKTSINFANTALRKLGNLLPESASALWINEELTWSDGVIVRFTFNDDAPKIAEHLSGVLDDFRSWAILDDRGGFAEQTNIGPVSSFFEKMDMQPKKTTRYSQLFLMWDEDDPFHADTISGARDHIKQYNSPVFFFEDGQIILIDTDEPGKITCQRISSSLRGMTGWCVLDSNRQTFSRSGSAESLWDEADFENLVE